MENIKAKNMFDFFENELYIIYKDVLPNVILKIVVKK